MTVSWERERLLKCFYLQERIDPVLLNPGIRWVYISRENPMKVLVVDDELIIHESLKKTLGREGFTVDSAFSAKEGLAFLARESYGLILTDLMMPEMDGLEFLREVQKAEYNIPTIMITGYPTIRTGLTALRMGAADYLPKPFTRKELLAPVRRALRGEAQESPVNLYTDDKGPPEEMDSGSSKKLMLMPGDRFRLPRHTWAVYDQDGTFFIGLEAFCFKAVGKVNAIHVPGENELVEQGYPGIILDSEDGEEHNIFLPLSGRVFHVNNQITLDPSVLNSDTWLLQIIPNEVQEELPYLEKVV